ncbi:MAG TPA: hypothetical protein VFC79_09325 [Tissierellaceae bacterium]|nr:hypothetical protein [Tissierellaceae bacterium]
MIDELLVKYKHIDDTSSHGYISATIYKGRVADILPVIKQVDSIKLNDDWFVYQSSEFQPSSGVGFLDVLYIYVEGYDERG